VQVAEVPVIHQSEHVRSVRELESRSMQKLKDFLLSKDEEHGGEPLDLSILLAHLLPEDRVMEPEEVWDEDLLLTEVASELQQRSDDQEAALADVASAPAPLMAS
jgi:Intraflagellar transport protein 43